MANLATQDIVAAGTKPTLVPAAASDTAEYGTGQNTFVVYKNTDTNAKVVTITSDIILGSGDPYPPKVYNLVANTGEVWIPLRKDYADDAAGAGRVTMAVTGTGGVTGVSVAVVRMG